MSAQSKKVRSEEQKRIDQLKGDTLADNTKKEYEYSWGLWTSFCKDRGIDPYNPSPKLITAYMVRRRDEDEVLPATIKDDLCAISWMHRRNGKPDPTDNQLVKQVLAGMRKEADPDEGKGKAQPTLTEDVQAMVEALPTEKPGANAAPKEKESYLRGLRDRALILIQYFAGLRRSEVRKIRVEHITPTDEGIVIKIPEAKYGPHEAPIVRAEEGSAPDSICPVKALSEWLEAAGIEAGPVFRSAKWGNIPPDSKATPASRMTVHRAVKLAAEAAGLDADSISTHSLRRGHITQGALNGADLKNLMKQAGHKSPETTAGYIDDALMMEKSSSKDL